MKHAVILTIGLLVFLTYVISIKISNPRIKSISESDYLLRRPWKFMFELTMFVSGITLIYSGYYILSKSILMIVGGIFIFCVGLFPRFKRNLYVRSSHYIFAIGGFTLCSISFIFNDQWIITILIGTTAIISYLIAEYSKLYYLETFLSIGIFTGVFCNYLIYFI